MKQTNLQLTENVRIEGNHVVKKMKLGRLQVQLMQNAHNLSMQTHSFYVPKVLDFDEETQTAKLEYLPEIISLKDYFRKHTQIANILYCIGDALACCHEQLKLSESEQIPALAPWLGNVKDQVTVHGDFNMTNLCYEPNMKKLVILDWETTPALPYQCNRASRYLDIVQFVRSLLLQQESIISGLFRFRKRVKIFLTAYQQTSEIQLDMNHLRHRLYDYNMAVIKKQWTQHKYRSGLQSILGNWIFRINLKKISTKKLAKLTTCKIR